MGADTVMTQGATQSNHARQTAAFAAKLGMACHILLEDRTGSNDPNYNAQRQRAAGSPARRHDLEARRAAWTWQAEMEAVADRLRAEGRKVYIIPGGGSNPTGALGYVNCAFELVGAGE